MKLRSFVFFILIISIFCNSLNAQSQEEERAKILSTFAMETKNYIEGYSQAKPENEFNYHSLRNDLNECLLSRCTTGDMAIEWSTQPVPENFNAKGAGFLWIAALDMTSEKHVFEVFINDILRFTLVSGDQESWEKSNSEGGSLKFITAEKDQHGDAHGYMALWAPKSWLTPGKSLNIKIVGKAENSSNWIIIYKAKDAVTYLQNSLKYNSSADITLEKKKEDYEIKVSVFPSAEGKKIKLLFGGKEFSQALTLSGNTGTAKFLVNQKQIKNELIALSDEFGEIISLNSFTKKGKETKLIYNALINSELNINDEKIIEIKGNRIYKPSSVNSLIKLSESNLSKGKIYLMNSSHQDIAWMDSPEKCIIERDTMLLGPLYKMAIKDSLYRFDVEDALILREFIHRHPDKKEGIKKLLKNGQISCGSSYIQPYEEMYSGEALVRQFYLGAKWLKDELGYAANTYWNPDVPGRTLQMPQILKKSGTKYLLISRFDKGIYNWYSPDGSFVTTYSPGHYSESFTPLQKNFYDASEYIANSSMIWEKYYASASKSTSIPLFSDWDMSPAKDYSSIIKQWNNISEIQNKEGKYSSINLPKIELSLTPDFLEHFEKTATNIPSIKGERPAVWLYIHGPSHQKAIKASREADILLTVAEKFATINALIDGSFKNYPQKQLTEAWEAKIYPDHGWGGKHGDITDDLFLSKYQFAKAESEKIIDASLSAIASNIKPNPEKGMPIVVFNSLNWKRTDLAKIDLNFDKSQVKNIVLSDAKGANITCQINNISSYEDGSIKSATIHFIAVDVPSIGYKTFYLKTLNKELTKIEINQIKTSENKFYKINFANGGLSSIFDKELNVEILNTEKFNAGEVFTLHSEGNGAGEFSDIQKTDMQGYDKAGNYQSDWKVSETGEVFTSFVNRQPIRNAVIEEKIIIYSEIKRIDFEISLLNWEGVLYREYRMALPVNMKNGQVSYEVPYGVVNVGKDELEGAAGERYKTLCKDVHPRGIENWIGISNDKFGLTLSSSVAVADYIDPTGGNIENQVLQPILMASRKSCHGEGNEYLQTGDHHFFFSLNTHKPGWENGFRFGRQANEKLMVVAGPKSFQGAILQEEMSFFSLDNDNLFISAIKKAEDGNNPVIRLFNISGKETNMELKSFKNFKEAFQTNLTEEKLNPLPLVNGIVKMKIGKNSIETLNIE